ncbi:MAG: carbonic anhydrase [Elusimicrobiota bacterium]
MKFATCLNCMDGRVQLPVIHWIKENYSVDYVDMITHPGMDGFLADKNCKYTNGLFKKMDISFEKHNSSILFVVGHNDCAGNPVDDKTHKKQIRIAVEKIKRWRRSVYIIGLWVSNKWTVEKITEK